MNKRITPISRQDVANNIFEEKIGNRSGSSNGLESKKGAGKMKNWMISIDRKSVV